MGEGYTVRGSLRLDPIRSAGLVSVCLAFPGPDRLEHPGQFGWDGLWTAVLRAGAGVLPEEEWAECFDEWGSGLSAFAVDGAVGLRYSCLPEALEKSLELLARLPGERAVDSTLLARERASRLAMVKEERDDPVTDALRRARLLAFGESALGHSPLGKEDDLRAATATGLHSFAGSLSKRFRPVLAVSGDFEPERIEGQWLGADREVISNPLHSPEEDSSAWDPFDEEVLHSREQSVVLECFRVGGYDDESELCRQLVLFCLNGLSGPLFEEIRERHGLAYFSNVQLLVGWRRGMLAFVSGCKADKIGFLRERLREVLLRLIVRGFSDEEFESGKSQWRSALLMNRQRTAWRADRLAVRGVQGRSPDLGEAAERFLGKVTQQDLCDWCESALHPDRGSSFTLRATPAPE